MIEVYHSSNMRVVHPDTRHSRKQLDFGPGFYFTSLRNQAEVYAHRFIRRGKEAWLNIYDFSEDWTGWNVKRFDKYDEEWLDFVMDCRNGNIAGNYDMVIGGIADDKVFDTLNLFFDKFIQKDEALRRLAYEKPNIQYCIRTDAMIKDCITFKDSIQL